MQSWAISLPVSRENENCRRAVASTATAAISAGMAAVPVGGEFVRFVEHQQVGARERPTGLVRSAVGGDVHPRLVACGQASR